MGAPESNAPLSPAEPQFSYEHEGDRQFATTLARGLEVLRCFTPLEPMLGNKEISVRTEISWLPSIGSSGVKQRSTSRPRASVVAN